MCSRLNGCKYDAITNKLYDPEFYKFDDSKIVPKLPLIDDFDEMLEEEEEVEDEEEDDLEEEEEDDFNFEEVSFFPPYFCLF